MESDELEGCVCVHARTCARTRGVLYGKTWKMVRKCNMTAMASEHHVRSSNSLHYRNQTPRMWPWIQSETCLQKVIWKEAPTSVSWESARMKDILRTFSMKEQRKAGPRSMSRACSPPSVIANGNQSWIHVLTNRGGQSVEVVTSWH